MPKSLLDIQISGDDCLVEFEAAARDLINTKYILADKRVSFLLQTIAKNKNLYALVKNCLQGFDFKAAFAEAKIDGNRGLNLPTERKNLVAFVFCLLLSFDTNQTDFKKFLHTFYFSSLGPGAEYELFASHVLVPFSEAVSKAYCQEAEAPAYAAPPPPHNNQSYSQPQNQSYSQSHYEQQASSAQSYSQTYGQVFSAPADDEQLIKDEDMASLKENNGLDQLAIASLQQSAREMIGIVARDSSLSMTEREELLLVCEAFEQAITLGATKPIRTMYIALKYTIRCSPLVRQLEIQCDNLDRLIQEYNLD